MLTRKLHIAYQDVAKLAGFLARREWTRTDELNEILVEANREIEIIQDRAIADVAAKLESYSEEARCWAENKMTDMGRNHINISAAKQRKSRTEYNRVRRTIVKLRDI